MIRRLPACILVLVLASFCLSACSRKEKPRNEEDVETAAESVDEPPERPSGEEPPEERRVEAVLSGDPASIDLAVLQLSSGSVMFRTEKDPSPGDPENLLSLRVFLYPVHDDRFRCRITGPTGTLLEERVLPPDQLPALLTRAIEKAQASAFAKIAIDGENKGNPCWDHELKMRLIRSSRIRIRPCPPASSVVSLSGNGRVFSVTINKRFLKIFPKSTSVAGTDSVKHAADLICRTLQSVPDPDEYLPAEEARALQDDLYRLSGAMKAYRRADYEKIVRLTSLMTSLVPDDPRFRFDQLWFSLLPLLDPELTPEQKKAVTDAFLKDAASFIRQYPDFPFPVLPSGDDRPFAGHPFCPLDPLRNAPESAPVCAWILTLRRGDADESESLPEPGPHASLAELLGWCEAVRRRSVDGLPGADAASLARLRFKNQLSLLRRVRSYAGSHPDEAAAVMPKTFFFPCEDRAPGSGREEFWKTVRFLILSEGKELIREAAALGTPESLRYAAELQALFDWSRSRGTAGEIRTVLAAKMDSLFKAGFRLRPGMSCGGYLADMISVLSPVPSAGENLMLILQAYPFEYVFRKEGIDPNQTMLCLVEAGVKDPGFLIRNAEKIRSLASRTLTDPTANNSYSILAASLFRRDPGDPQVRQAISLLNDRFEIRRIPSPGGRCLASCLWRNTLFMLRRNDQGILSVTAADLVSGTASDLAMPPVPFRDLQGAVRVTGEPEACTISAADGWLTVCGENTILLYDLERKIWKKCAGLPGRFPVCARVRGGRLFYLCGGVPGPEGSDKILSLRSCKLDGTDPRVYFDGGRSLLHPFDTLGKGRVTGFFSVKGGWLFTASSRNHFAKICLFDPVKGVLSNVEELPPAFRIFALKENADSLLGQGGDAFFLCSVRNDPRKRSWLFSQTLSDDRTKAALRIPGCGAFQMPAALLAGRYLVSARSGASPSLIDLKDWKRSPLLFLPECAGVFCGPESGTLVFPAVLDGTVFILRLKQQP